MNADILTGLRSLLLTFDGVTAICGDRIRPNKPHSKDGNRPQIILQLPEADQQNFLDRTDALMMSQLAVIVRGEDYTACTQLAELVRTNGTDPSTGLDGYSGAAGSCSVLQCERVGYSTGFVLDDDGDETDVHEFVQAFDIMFLVTG